MSDRINVAFLFGAGAEQGTSNFNMPTGSQYMKNTMFDGELQKNIGDSLEKFWGKQKYFDNSYKYEKNFIAPNKLMFQNLLQEKALRNEDFLKDNIKYIASILDGYSIKELKVKYGEDKYDFKSSHNITYTTFKNEFKEILTKKKDERKINSNLLKSLFYDRNGTIDFDFNICTAGYMESYFHTIINPNKYGKIKFSKVFNYYWICYFVILKEILKYLRRTPNNMHEFLESEDLGYNTILCNINKITKLLYSDSIDICKTGSYYDLIAKKFKDMKGYIDCVGVATTNYYRFCEIITKQPIYLNGQLKYFEFPEILEVKDASIENASDFTGEKLFFPFIFGQSLIKPIVSDIQIDAFTEFKSLLNKTDILVVLGYNINEDDNHINALLHKYAKSKGILIAVGEEETAGGKTSVAEKFKCSEDDIEYCTVKYGDNTDVINKIFNKVAEGSK